MVKPVLTLHQPTTAKALAFLQLMAKAGPEVVADSLNWIADFWAGEVKRHMPVDQGLAKNSVTADYANGAENPIVAQVGTNVPYVPHLEFGTKRIAGGRVLDWTPGAPPILDWPAKMAELRPGDDGMGSNAEFMPPFRASWDRIAERVLANMRKRVASLMKQGRA